mgnify:CR=1 FL=1
MTHPIVREINKQQRKKQLPQFNVGDTVEVRVRVKEGEKERLQPFIGTVIARRGGESAKATFTVRRIVQGSGVERTFPLHSPVVETVRVRHRGEVRRAKLYYLRERTGKATRIKGRVVHEAERRRVEEAARAALEEAEKAEAGAEQTAESAEAGSEPEKSEA